MDSRDREACMGKDYERFDEDRMVIIVELEDEEGWEEECELPAKYEVCELCSGKGKHVNPSIDAHGISAEEFSEDPDFAEDYFRGRFDVTCFRCNGARVEPVVDEGRCPKDLLERWQDHLRYRASVAREHAYERRFGY